MRIHDTALKHGIDPEDIMRAAAWPLWIIYRTFERQNRTARSGRPWPGDATTGGA